MVIFGKWEEPVDTEHNSGDTKYVSHALGCDQSLSTISKIWQKLQ